MSHRTRRRNALALQRGGSVTADQWPERNFGHLGHRSSPAPEPCLGQAS